MAVASIGPATTGRPRALAANWLSSRFCVPPPTMCSTPMRLTDQRLQHLQRRGDTSAPGSRSTTRAIVPTSCGHGLAGARGSTPGCAPACRRARRKSGASTSMNAVNEGLARPRRVARCRPRRASAPAGRHVRRHSWTIHSPVMFFSRRIVSQTPPSLVKLSVSAVSLMTGCGRLHAHQRPGAGAEVGVVVALGGHRGDGGLAVSWLPGAITCTPCAPVSSATAGQQLAQHRARRDDRRKIVRRDAQPLEQAGRPGRAVRDRAPGWCWRWCTR